MTLEEALVSVCKQALIEGATTVELEGRNYTVKKTSRHHLRQVDFIFDGQELRGPEQNPHTQSQRARLAQEASGCSFCVLQSVAAHNPAAYERPRHKEAPHQASFA